MVARLHDHIIVCGGGETGQFIAAELQKVGREFVVIEKDEERSDRLSRKPGMHVLNGDATEDATLEEAGIDRATGVIAALTGDKDNLFVVITARQLNAGVKIVARTVDPTADRKLNQAGADVVIAASTIAADRMVSAMVRPHVVSLFDRLLRDPASTHRIEEVRVESGSELAGSTLGEAHLGRRTGLLVLAIQPPGSHFECNPTVDTKLAADSLLVVMGDVDNFDQLHRMAAGRSSV